MFTDVSSRDRVQLSPTHTGGENNYWLCEVASSVK